MNIAKANVRRCATCASWFGGSRLFDDKGNVKYDASPRNTGVCKHPLSGKTNQQTKPEYTCSKWMQGS